MNPQEILRAYLGFDAQMTETARTIYNLFILEFVMAKLEVMQLR